MITRGRGCRRGECEFVMPGGRAACSPYEQPASPSRPIAVLLDALTPPRALCGDMEYDELSFLSGLCLGPQLPSLGGSHSPTWIASTRPYHGSVSPDYQSPATAAAATERHWCADLAANLLQRELFGTYRAPCFASSPLCERMWVPWAELLLSTMRPLSSEVPS